MLRSPHLLCTDTFCLRASGDVSSGWWFLQHQSHPPAGDVHYITGNTLLHECLTASTVSQLVHVDPLMLRSWRFFNNHKICETNLRSNNSYLGWMLSVNYILFVRLCLDWNISIFVTSCDNNTLQMPPWLAVKSIRM